jgi:hypothetical protein
LPWGLIPFIYGSFEFFGHRVFLSPEDDMHTSCCPFVAFIAIFNDKPPDSISKSCALKGK